MKKEKASYQNPCMKSFGKKFKKYRDCKKFSIKLCTELVTKKTMEEINTYKKRDDICESILHGIAYTYKKTKIPNKIKDFVEKYDIKENSFRVKLQ